MMNEQSQKLGRLRQAAESLLDSLDDEVRDLDRDQIKALVQELRVHQIELSLQNEELLATQREMEAARDKYTQLYHSAPVGYLSLDENGIILQANHTFMKMAGQTSRGLLGRPLADLLLKEDQAVFLARYRSFFKSPEDKAMDLRLSHGQGHSHVRLQGKVERLLSTKSGAAPKESLLAVVSDISEQKKWEKALAGQAGFLETLLEALPNPVFYQDRDGLCLGCNRAFQELLGLERREIVGRPLESLWPAGAGKILGQQARELWYRPGTARFEVEMPGDGGGARSLIVYQSTFGDSAEAVAGLVGVMADISERRRMEARLIRESGLNKALAELAQALLMGRGQEEISELVLDQARNLTGSPHGFVGYLDPASGHLVCPTLTRDIWEGCRIEGKSIVFEGRKGLWGWVLDNRRPMFTNQPQADPRSGGVPGGHINISRFMAAPVAVGERLLGMVALANAQRDYEPDDLEALQRLADLYGLAVRHMWTERDLFASREAAVAGNQAKSQFLATMSHEIRTPLNAIMGVAHLLQDTPLDHQQGEYLEIIANSSSHLLSLVGDILDLSKIESGAFRLDNMRFGLRRSLGEIVAAQSPKALAKGLDLRWRVDDKAPEGLLGDKIRLQQVLINLVDNAVKFTEQGSISLEVSLRDQGPTGVGLEFVVRDTGLGVATDKQQAIFEPFVQADSSNTRRVGGTGLGLAISKRLVRAMGGELGLVSAPGQGSAFRFILRLPTADVPEAEAPASPPPAAGSGSLSVLLVEDNRINQTVAVALLKKRGHRVAVADNGLLALEALEGKRPDLVFMDIEMPEMDGLQATAAIRAREEQMGLGRIPIVAMTAHAMRGDRERFLAAGMDDYVSKPIDPKHLDEAVARVMAGRAAGEA